MRATSETHKYTIAWAPKSGCTRWRQLFLHLHQDELPGGPSRKWHHLAKDFPWNPAYKDIIFVTRNPYKRAVSMFTNKVCGKFNEWNIHDKLSLHHLTFRNFLLHLQRNKNRLHEIDIHVQPQSRSVDMMTNRHRITIIKIEEFDEKINQAYESIGLDILTPKIQKFLNQDVMTNITPRNNQTTFCGDTVYTIDDVVFPDYQYFYNDQLVSIVRDVYKRDFELCGYETKYDYE